MCVDLWGLLDTGADACLFPAQLATMLGHDLKGDGVKSSFNMGIEQKKIVVYRHTFRIDLLCPKQEKVVWSSGDVEIDCSETNPPTLIGVQNFMKNFKITFDYINSELTLKW